MNGAFGQKGVMPVVDVRQRDFDSCASVAIWWIIIGNNGLITFGKDDYLG